jgi:hypothetical protein
MISACGFSNLFQNKHALTNQQQNQELNQGKVFRVPTITVFPLIVSAETILQKLFFFEFGNPKVIVYKAKGHSK